MYQKKIINHLGLVLFSPCGIPIIEFNSIESNIDANSNSEYKIFHAPPLGATLPLLHPGTLLNYRLFPVVSDRNNINGSFAETLDKFNILHGLHREFLVCEGV